VLQRQGPHGKDVPAELRAIDSVCGDLIEIAKKDDARIVVLSEYGITEVSGAVPLNQALRRAGLVEVRRGDAGEILDAGASEAFAVVDHQLAHVYVKRRERVQEVAQLLRAQAGVEAVWGEAEKRAHGLDHPRSGELVAVSARDRWFSYPYWLDDDRAPDFARTVDIHRKPGYDPVELFLDPAIHIPALKIGWSTRGLMGFDTETQVAAAIKQTAQALADMGHRVEEESPQLDGLAAMRFMLDVWFFGFDLRLAGYSKRTGHAIGPETLEPVIFKIYQYARQMKAEQFLAAMLALNAARRQLGQYFTKYDVWLSPTTARVAEPWGNYNLGRADVSFEELPEKLFRPVCEFTLPHNIMGTPAISLPLVMHSSGLPIGVQLAAGPANEHLLLQLAAALEMSMPWAGRTPPLHVSKLS